MKKIIKNKYFLIALLVTGIIFAAAFYFFNIEETTDSKLIVLTEEGFSPMELTINVGDTVTFVTERDKFFWPASNLHPSHSMYSDFDPKEPIDPNESWSFTFEQGGKWEFHDHLAPYFIGVISVLDEGLDIEKCSEGLDCWQESILNELENNGLDAAFDVVARLYSEDAAFADSCHFITHNLGFAGYRSYLKDSSSILTNKTTYCASGFYHGLMEAHLGATGDIEEAKKICSYVDNISDVAPDASLQCYHGIGHGAMETVVADQGIFSSEDEMIDEALKICEKASDTEEQLYRCASGIFNGISNFYISNEYGLSVEKRNPLEICEIQKEIYKEPCYGNMNSVLMWRTDNNFIEAAAYVVAIKDETQKHRAFNYLSAQYALSNLQTTDFSEVVSSCRTIPFEYRQTCIEGFSQGLMEHGVPGKEYIKALNFCRTDSMTVEETNICFSIVLRTLPGWYGEEKSRDICFSAEDEYHSFCTY